MKKSLKKKGEPETPRRLALHRETIQSLDEPALLEIARGGATQTQATGCILVV